MTEAATNLGQGSRLPQTNSGRSADRSLGNGSIPYCQGKRLAGGGIAGTLSTDIVRIGSCSSGANRKTASRPNACSAATAQVPPAPNFPPLTESVEEFFRQMVDEPVTDVAATDESLIMVDLYAQTPGQLVPVATR
jgi:hypothetical protein